jgi:putative membrane protein
MDRRVVLVGFAAAVATPAFSQMGRMPPPSPAEGGMGSAESGSPMVGAGMSEMGQAEMQHMQDTMRLGSEALETSRLALDKARNRDLRQFAQFEVNEQQTIAEVLRSMMDPAATAATGFEASPASSGMGAATSDTPMEAEGRPLIEQLRGAQIGAAFDRAYLQGQIKGHRDLLQVQERYIESNPQNREHLNIAKLARGHIREHISMLEAMQQMLR